MSRLYHVALDGRCLGFIVQDRPMEEYAARTDLTTQPPPDTPTGYSAFLTGGRWVLQQDPSAPAPQPIAPRLWQPWLQGK